MLYEIKGISCVIQVTKLFLTHTRGICDECEKTS